MFIEVIRELQKKADEEYEAKVRALLGHYGVESPDQLNEAQKSEFFERLDASHISDEEELGIDSESLEEGKVAMHPIEAMALYGVHMGGVAGSIPGELMAGQVSPESGYAPLRGALGGYAGGALGGLGGFHAGHRLADNPLVHRTLGPGGQALIGLGAPIAGALAGGALGGYATEKGYQGAKPLIHAATKQSSESLEEGKVAVHWDKLNPFTPSGPYRNIYDFDMKVIPGRGTEKAHARQLLDSAKVELTHASPQALAGLAGGQLAGGIGAHLANRESEVAPFRGLASPLTTAGTVAGGLGGQLVRDSFRYGRLPHQLGALGAVAPYVGALGGGALGGYATEKGYQAVDPHGEATKQSSVWQEATDIIEKIANQAPTPPVIAAPTPSSQTAGQQQSQIAGKFSHPSWKLRAKKVQGVYDPSQTVSDQMMENRTLK